MLEVDDVSANTRFQVADGLGQVLREGYLSEDAKVGCVEESRAGFSLQLPEVAIGVDDAVAYGRLEGNASVSGGVSHRTDPMTAVSQTRPW